MITHKYLWINPVIEAMAGSCYSSVLSAVSKLGFIVVPCASGLKRVRDSYKKTLETKGHRPLIDTRCPLIHEMVACDYPELADSLADVPPILMACAQEVYDEYVKTSLDTASLTIVTPCSPLAAAGNVRLGAIAYFITWTEFCQTHNIEINLERAEASPIPPGFFRFPEYKVCEASGEIPVRKLLDQVSREVDKIDLLELLYCPEGCHNGDGVVR